MTVKTQNLRSLSLLTDLYQLTMAYGYHTSGIADIEAVFHLFFRNHPFKGGYTVSCGQNPVLDFLDQLSFSQNDVSYLETLTGNDGQALFDKNFLNLLGNMKLDIQVLAVPEGTVVFPHEPIIRVQGPLIQCQLLETPLLNIINFQSLIATKAARVCYAACGDPVLEFGLRRAQGIDGALSASRAAYIGGCAATSNVLAGKIFGIPVKGTHAHSWVMAFNTELESFLAYGEAMPNNCVFLVDTYDTLEGVKSAIAVGHTLRKRGHEMVGIRLDSGDLSWLSNKSRALLNEAGFSNAVIIASNDLDEHLIQSLKDQGARINMWGVGTKLVTAHGQSALGGVYKLSALRPPNKEWTHKLKLSEQTIKTSNPGILQVVRHEQDELFTGDAIIDELNPPVGSITMLDPTNPSRQKKFTSEMTTTHLLEPVFNGRKRLISDEPLDTIQQRVKTQLEQFHTSTKRFDNPHEYPVGLEQGLFDQKARLIRTMRHLE